MLYSVRLLFSPNRQSTPHASTTALPRSEPFVSCRPVVFSRVCKQCLMDVTSQMRGAALRRPSAHLHLTIASCSWFVFLYQFSLACLLQPHIVSLHLILPLHPISTLVLPLNNLHFTSFIKAARQTLAVSGLALPSRFERRSCRTSSPPVLPCRYLHLRASLSQTPWSQ